jgi:hypothetical protein
MAFDGQARQGQIQGDANVPAWASEGAVSVALALKSGNFGGVDSRSDHGLSPIGTILPRRQTMSAFGGKTDILILERHVCF